jgi:hypothetical protein
MAKIFTIPTPSLIPHQLLGAKLIKAAGSNLTIGDTDIYTVPTGKKALIQASVGRSYNPSAGNITYYTEIKVSGTYYRISSNTLLTTGTGNVGNITAAMVLGAGEILAINTATTNGLNVWTEIIEYDATDVRLVTGRVLSLANGDNTIYTVSAGKTAIRGNIIAGTNCLGIANSSGGARTMIIYQVPSGGSSGSTNQMTSAGSFADLSVSTVLNPGTMDTGDFIVVNTNSGLTGQTAWVTMFEV